MLCVHRWFVYYTHTLYWSRRCARKAWRILAFDYIIIITAHNKSVHLCNDRKRVTVPHIFSLLYGLRCKMVINKTGLAVVCHSRERARSLAHTTNTGAERERERKLIESIWPIGKHHKISDVASFRSCRKRNRLAFYDDNGVDDALVNLSIYFAR